MEQKHARLFGAPSPFAMVAGGASSHYVRPYVLTPLVPGQDMIYRKACFASTAILARIIVSSEDFAPREFDVGAWAMYLQLQAND